MEIQDVVAFVHPNIKRVQASYRTNQEMSNYIP